MLLRFKMMNCSDYDIVLRLLGHDWGTYMQALSSVMSQSHFPTIKNKVFKKMFPVIRSFDFYISKS